MADQINVRFVEQGGQELENKVAKLEGEYRKLKQSLAESSKAGKEAGLSLSQYMGQAGQAAAGTITQFFSAAAAVQGIVSAYKEWRQEAHAAYEQVKKENADLTQSLARTGTIFEGPTVRKMFGELQAAGTPATMEQLRGIYQGIAAGSRDVLHDRSRLQMTMSLAGTLAPLEGEGVGQFAEQIAGAQEVGGLSPRAAAALVYAARGKLSSEGTAQLFSRRAMSGVRAFQQSGAGTFEEGMALAALGIEKDLPTGVTENLMARLSSSTINRAPKSRAEAMGNQIARLPANKRLAAILAAPEDVQQELIGARLTGGLARFGELKDWQQTFTGATAGEGEDWWFRTITTDEFQKANERGRLSVREEQAARRMGQRETGREKRRREEDIQWKDLNWLERGWNKFDRGIQETFEALDESVFGVKSDRGMVQADVGFGVGLGGNSTAAAVGILGSIDKNLKTQQATAAANNARVNAGER